jgi:AraC-like DNA-binding protein
MPADIMDLTTNDPDQAHKQLNQLYAPDRPIRFSGDPEHFDFSLLAAQTGDLHGGRVRHSSVTEAEHAPFEGFLTATVLAGGYSWRAGREQVSLRRGDVVRYPTTSGSNASWADVTVALIRIPMAAVGQSAQAHSGLDPADLRFHRLTPVSPAMTRRWRALTGFVHRTLAVDGAMLDSPLIRAHLTDMIATTALTVFPNSTMTAEHTPGAGRVAPAALRRAVAYLDDHATEPVTLVEVAEAAGVTPRALQAAFRQHYSMTPMGYLRRVRLEGAHRDLQTAGPGQESVTAVAYRWGFSSPSRFAAYYRSAYGVLPSRTLRG